jgi:hypothetical protein
MTFSIWDDWIFLALWLQPLLITVSTVLSLFYTIYSLPLQTHYDSVSTNRLVATGLNIYTITSNHYEVFLYSVTLYSSLLICTQQISQFIKYRLHSRLCTLSCLVASTSLLQLTTGSESKSKSHCDWRSVNQSVSHGVDPNRGLMTRWFLLFDSYGLVNVGRPFWREDGSVFFKVIVCSSKSFVIMWRIFTFYMLKMPNDLCQSRLSTADYALFLVSSATTAV